MNTEQKQRLGQIEKWADSFRTFYCTPENAKVFEQQLEDAHRMVKFLLSIVKGQEAGSVQVCRGGECCAQCCLNPQHDHCRKLATAPVAVWISDPYGDINRDSTVHEHKHYDDDVRYFREDVFNTNYEGLLRASLLREQDTAASTRSRCVEKVKLMRDE